MVGGDEIGARHLAQIGAGAERLLRAGDHDGADALILLELEERGVQVGDQAARQRVQRLRPVKTDQADLVAALDQDVLIGHLVLRSN